MLLIHRNFHRILYAPLVAAALSIANAGEPSAKAPVDPPAPDPQLSDFWTKAKITADLRVRYEYGDQFPLITSHAATARARLGVMTGSFAGFQGFAEYEGTFAGDRGTYRAGSISGPKNRTVIADPESHELNRAWLSWTGGDTKIKAGRQRIILNNARYIGNVGWRQNEQTYDAVRIDQKFGDFDLTYAYFWQVLRIFGSETPALAGQEDFEGSSHILHGTYKGLPNTTIGAYAYLLELDNGAGSANSSNSFGAYIDGFVPVSEGTKLTYYGEYGYQTEGTGSPLEYNAHYLHVKGGAVIDKVTMGVGYEHLGSDNGVGYKFPLGTNHAFNGFADKFLGTPANGLADLYVYGGVKLPAGFGTKVAYHWLGSDGGSFEYGQEIDFVLTKKINDNLSALGKFAYYMADDFATDTTRFSVELNYKF